LCYILKGAAMENTCFEHYWDGQAPEFTKVYMYELQGAAYEVWKNILMDNLPKGECLNILDAGCGAGFFGIVLSRFGHRVTETDRSAEMLEEARRNIWPEENNELVRFEQADAQKLDFPDGTYDVVVSRNVTWALPDPEAAYREWLRVLKPGGVLLNFDSNWFLHRRDAEAKAAYEAGTALVKEAGLKIAVSDHNGELDSCIDALPLSAIRRPGWDERLLRAMKDLRLTILPSLPDVIYDDYYRLQYRYIPTFMIRAEKQA
jgi:ubiquinone/menaquinone biosynthesis C-methylase UbiE